MKKRKLWIIGGVLLVGCLALSAAMVFKPFEGGPRYKGFSASYWARALKSGSSHDSSVRSKVERYLGLTNYSGDPSILDGDPAAAPVLLRLVGNGDAIIGVYARGGLVRIAVGPRAKDAVGCLKTACNDENAAIREAATRYLQWIEWRIKIGTL